MINQYINQTTFQTEQNLLESLIIESIQFYGIDVVYVPRTKINFDKLFGEDIQSAFTSPYQIEMYLKTFGNYEGQGSFLSKFGLEIKDEMTWQVARSRFTAVVTTVEEEIIRPREGDLIYYGPSNSLFEISFVQPVEDFYQLGKLYTWEVKTKRYTLSQETIDTGIPAVDYLKNERYQITYNLTSGFGAFQAGEWAYQGTSLIAASAKGKVLSYDFNTDLLVLIEVAGEFKPNINIEGETSMASWIFDAVADVAIDTSNPSKDNDFLEDDVEDAITNNTNDHPYGF